MPLQVLAFVEMATQRQISRAELAAHNTERDGWVALHGRVFDVTGIQHPGGPQIRDNVGTDATEVFRTKHGVNHLSDAPLVDRCVGVFVGGDVAEPSSPERQRETAPAAPVSAPLRLQTPLPHVVVAPRQRVAQEHSPTCIAAAALLLAVFMGLLVL